MTDVNANGIQTQEVTLYDADGVPIPVTTGVTVGNGTVLLRLNFYEDQGA